MMMMMIPYRQVNEFLLFVDLELFLLHISLLIVVSLELATILSLALPLT